MQAEDLMLVPSDWGAALAASVAYPELPGQTSYPASRKCKRKHQNQQSRMLTQVVQLDKPSGTPEARPAQSVQPATPQQLGPKGKAHRKNKFKQPAASLQQIANNCAQPEAQWGTKRRKPTDGQCLSEADLAELHTLVQAAQQERHRFEASERQEVPDWRLDSAVRPRVFASAAPAAQLNAASDPAHSTLDDAVSGHAAVKKPAKIGRAKRLRLKRQARAAAAGNQAAGTQPQGVNVQPVDPGAAPASTVSAQLAGQQGLRQPAEHQLPADNQPAKSATAGLLGKMRAKLSGSRFRALNEQLYTLAGDAAFKLMQQEPELFEEYHQGFREQTQHWPAQPVQAAIAWLKGKPRSWQVVDFGCGDAQLAASVQQKVHSLDLVAAAPGVIACNMAHTPLGSCSVDAAIFCLALMGTDYGGFLEEAHRLLRPGGLLWIAEVRSRFSGQGSGEQQRGDDLRSFAKALKQQGFEVQQKDASNKMFVVLEAQKQRAATPLNTVHWPVLKPCLYKRR